jgi:hypothetical protein
MTPITRSYPSVLGYDGSARVAMSAWSIRPPTRRTPLTCGSNHSEGASRSASVGGREMTRWVIFNRSGQSCLPRRQSHGLSRRQDAARRRDETDGGGAGPIPAARAPLADPARPLHLHRAAAIVREMHYRRSVQMAGEDGERGGRCLAVIASRAKQSSAKSGPMPLHSRSNRIAARQRNDAKG